MEETQTSWRVIEAQVDYWSGTTSDPKLGDEAYERVRDYVECDRLGSYDGTRASIQGYVGVSSGHTFAGQSESGTYIRFSSVDARDRWRDFCRSGLRTSRIDLCVTNQASLDVPSVAYSIRYGPRLPARVRGQSPRVEFFSKEDGGDTAYIGSPRSDRRGRVYDKGRESPSSYALGAWRWEVQLRHGPSHDIGFHLASRDTTEEWIMAYVRDWFDERGIYAPWTAAEGQEAFKTARVDTNDARRMQWLRTSVAPMVHRLMARYSNRELRAALGLQYQNSEGVRTRITEDRR